MTDYEMLEERVNTRMEYIAKFGIDEWVPLDDLPDEYQDPAAMTELYRRCLNEGRPVRELIELPEDAPGAIYN